MHAHTYIVFDTVPCGEILRAAYIAMKYAVRFRGWQKISRKYTVYRARCMTGQHLTREIYSSQVGAMATAVSHNPLLAESGYSAD